MGTRAARGRSGGKGSSDALLRTLGLGAERIPVQRALVLELGRLYHLVVHAAAHALAPVALTPQQYAVLEIAERSGAGIGQDELRFLMFCSRPNLSGLVDRLVRSGLLVRRAARDDRRRRVLAITRRGRAKLLLARPAYRGRLTSLFAGTPPGRLRALVAGVRTVRQEIESRGLEAARSNEEDRP